MGKWFSFGKNKKLFGVTKLDLEIISHFKRHGKFIQAEILARCPLCKEDHRVLFFVCKCGDPFFTHLQNAENNFELLPTGKLDLTKANWSKMFE